MKLRSRTRTAKEVSVKESTGSEKQRCNEATVFTSASMPSKMGDSGVSLVLISERIQDLSRVTLPWLRTK